MNITNDIRYIGVNDRKIDLFEGQYRVPNGMAYNSYAIIDSMIAIMDTVDAGFTHEWLDNIRDTLGSRKPDFLIVQHMEPDHSANIMQFAKTYPEAKIVSSAKAFRMMQNFFGTDFADPASWWTRATCWSWDITSCISYPLPWCIGPRSS